MELPSKFALRGVPGSGKTTKLEEIIEKAITEMEIPAKDIKVFTYRKSVQLELMGRLAAKFDLTRDEARETSVTLHSLATGYYFSKLDGRAEAPEFIEYSKKIRQPWNQFKKEYGHDMRAGGSRDSPETNSPLFNAYTYYRSTGRDLKAVVNRGLYSDPDYLLEVEKDLEEYKKRNNLIELYDCMDAVIKDKYSPDASLVLVDEAQDLNPLMYGMINNFSGNVDYIGLAGDPFQCLYPFYGASPEYLINFPDARTFELGQTRRLYKEHYEVAKFIIHYGTRYTAPDVKTKGEGGKLYYVNPEYAAALTARHSGGRGVYHLARTNLICGKIAHTLSEMGIPFVGRFGWEPWKVNLFNALNKASRNQALTAGEITALRANTTAENKLVKAGVSDKIMEEAKANGGTRNYRSLFNGDIWHWNNNLTYSIKKNDNDGDILRKQISALSQKGYTCITNEEARKVSVMTIHASKGLEAETVFLYTEIPTAVQKNLLNCESQEEEAFVWYVGASRSLKNLYVVTGAGKNYTIPEPAGGWDN